MQPGKLFIPGTGEAMRLLVIVAVAGTLIVAAAVASLGGGVSAVGAVAPDRHGILPPRTSPDLPPVVRSTDPARESTGTSVSAHIRACFSSTMNRTATESGFVYSDGPDVRGAANGTVSWSTESLEDDCIAFNPDENLRATATYSVRLNASIVNDANGRFLDGDGDGIAEGSPGDDYRWNFTVEALDRSSPFVAATYPEDGAEGVAVTANITITFSEAMNTARVSEAVVVTVGTTTLTAANGTEEWTVGDEVYAFTPVESLPKGVVVRVTLNGSAARDRAGNLLDGDGNGTGGGNLTFSFTTALEPDTTPPGIAGVDPPDGAAYVPRWPVITILFSEAMDRQSVPEAITISHGASPVRFAWPNPGVVNFSTASPLAYKTTYTVSVAAGARDLAGNVLSAPFSFTFTTTPWIGAVSGSVVEAQRPIPNASVSLDGRETLTSASGAFTLEGVEQGTYVLNITGEGYVPHSEAVTIDASHHDLGAIVLQERPFDPGPLPWALVGAVVASAVLLFSLLRRRPGLDATQSDDWRPAEAVAVAPEQEPRKP